jgi:hypothetical protein
MPAVGEATVIEVRFVLPAQVMTGSILIEIAPVAQVTDRARPNQATLNSYRYAPIKEPKMNDLVLPAKAADWHKLKTLVLDSVSSPISPAITHAANSVCTE